MTMAYQARNVRFFPGMGYELEYQHPELGWIPYTAVENDSEELGRILFEACKQGQYGPVGNLPSKTKEQLLADVAHKRWEVETGGVTVAGMLINTEDRSKLLLNGSASKASRSPDYTLRWKLGTEWITLTAAQVLTIADAVADFVQACFDREETLSDAVRAGTYTETMLNEGWPT